MAPTHTFPTASTGKAIAASALVRVWFDFLEGTVEEKKVILVNVLVLKNEFGLTSLPKDGPPRTSKGTIVNGLSIEVRVEMRPAVVGYDASGEVHDEIAYVVFARPYIVVRDSRMVQNCFADWQRIEFAIWKDGAGPRTVSHA
jgi:hypothetical protein